jgi:hypothetical protein
LIIAEWYVFCALSERYKSKEVAMKQTVLLLVLLFCALTFTVEGQDERGGVQVVPDTVATDSTEYELIVLDQGFELWFLMQPVHQHSLEYYRNRNMMYVSEWNNRYMNPQQYGDIYDCLIDYQSTIDYGIEFERRLYYYFRYFEDTNDVRLLPTGR